MRNHEPKLAQVPGEHLELTTGDTEGIHSVITTLTRQEDAFYARLFQLVSAMTHRPRIVLCEVGDMEQAKRVIGMLLKSGDWAGTREFTNYNEKMKRQKKEKRREKGIVETLEIWQDSPDIPAEGATDGWENITSVEGQRVVVRGTGLVRAVFIRYR